MYVDIGGDVIIDSKEIFGIFDIDKLTVYKANREYLSKKQGCGKIVSVSDKIPKSFIVCVRNCEEVIYISPLMTSTISKRLSKLEF